MLEILLEILLSACMAEAPGQCRTERLATADGPAQCAAEAQAAAESLSREEPGWTPQAWPCVPAGETPAFTVTEIAPGVFVHKGLHEEPTPENRGDVSNFGFIIGGEAVAAVDAGDAPHLARAMLAEIRLRTDLPVRWLILTHMHPDHVLGAQVFHEAGATVVSAAKLPRGLAARAETYVAAQERLLAEAYEPLEVILPQETVAAVREIDLGGRILRLEAHPTAHTDNDLSVYDLATETWFLGDLVFIDHMPALDGSLLGWMRLMDALTQRPAARIVPGHGPVSAPWPEAAAAQQRYFADLAERTRAAIARGQRIGAAAEAIGGAPEGKWLLVEAFGVRNATAAFQELEWE